MQKYFEKIKERLEEKMNHSFNQRYKAFAESIEIVNQVAEECKNDIVWQLAVMYATNFCKHGIDVTAKLETATQNAYAINQAYMRGKQDALKKFDEWREEYVTDTNVGSNDGWIPVSEWLPDEKGEYYVTYHPCYWDHVYDEVCVGLDTFRGNASWAKNKYQRVIAWKPKDTPYQPKGE